MWINTNFLPITPDTILLSVAVTCNVLLIHVLISQYNGIPAICHAQDGEITQQQKTWTSSSMSFNIISTLSVLFWKFTAANSESVELNRTQLVPWFKEWTLITVTFTEVVLVLVIKSHHFFLPTHTYSQQWSTCCYLVHQ